MKESKTGRKYGAIAARIRAVAASRPQFTRLDVGLDCHGGSFIYNLVRRGELRIVQPGRPGQHCSSLTVYQKA